MTNKVFNGSIGYKKLSFLPFNRDFALRESLVKSMQDRGFITHIYCCYSKVITGGRELYVLDGQHRALAAQYLNIPFHVAILDIEPTTTEELVNLVAIYNNTSVCWQLDTYCKAYAILGKPDYVELLRMSKENGQTVSTVAFLLGGSTCSRSLSNSTLLKTGMFKIHAKVTAEETLALAKTLDYKMSGRMIMAFHYVRLTKDNFNFLKFKKEFNKEYKNLKNSKLDDFTDKFIIMGT